MSNPLLTPEDRLALEEVKHQVRLRDRKTRVTTQLRDATKLRHWMIEYAYWYAFAVKVNVGECRIRASGCARDSVTAAQVRQLHTRPDFRELVEKFQAGGIEAARTIYEQDAVFYAESHRKGLEMAIAEADYAAIPKFTSHPLENIAPRRNDLGQQNLQVNVVLSPRQQAREDAPEIEVIATPVVHEKDAHDV